MNVSHVPKYTFTKNLSWDLPQWSAGKEPTCNARDTGDMSSIPGLGRSLEEEVATLSSILAWRIPWTEEPGGLRSVGHKESDRTE